MLPCGNSAWKMCRPSRRGVSRNVVYDGVTYDGEGRPSRRGVSRNIFFAGAMLELLSRPSRRGVSRNQTPTLRGLRPRRVAPPAGA